jgi:hypothetical protein
MVTGRLRPGLEYLAHRKIGGLLAQAARGLLAADIAAFTTAASELNYGALQVKRAAERILVRLLIQTGRPMSQLRVSDLDHWAGVLRRRDEASGKPTVWNWSVPDFIDTD